MLRALRTFLLLLLINNYLLASSEYGWVQDIVGIDESRFNYEDGSDADLELYLKNSFFSSVKLSPDGKHLAFQSKSDEFTEGILVAKTDDFLDPNKGLEKATVAKAAMKSSSDKVLGVPALYLCDFNWVSNSIILVEVCGKQFDRLQGEIFSSLGRILNGDEMAKFMSGNASLLTTCKIIISMPKIPFIKSFFYVVYRKWFNLP